MTNDDFQSLPAWFQDLSGEIRRSGTPAEITAGLACVHHRLALNTKDCDIWIPPASLQLFKDIVVSRTWQNQFVRYRSSFSAPLDARWLDGGWSSHILWDGPPRAQIDVFGIPPRTLHPASQNAYSDEETLARVKMTQREKDWPTVHALGERLIAHSNPKGLLFLQTAETLLQAKGQVSTKQWATETYTRPLLNTIDPSSPTQRLDAYLRIEQTFWRNVDKYRLAVYEEVVKPYAKLAKQVLNTTNDFREQDAELIKIAESILPRHPLDQKALTIVDQASEDALTLVDTSQFNNLWLPTEWAKTTIRRCYAPERPPQTKTHA